MYLLETFVWVLALRNFRFGSYLCLLTRFAAFGLLSLAGHLAAFGPLLLDWPLYGLLLHMFWKFHP